MMTRLWCKIQQFQDDEGGQIAIEFVVMAPLLFTIFITSMELGIYSMRQMWLDRGLDIAVRQVRLNTSSIPSHDALKQTICSNAGFVPDCESSLKLEMVLMDPRAISPLDGAADCIDQSQPISSQLDPNFVSGQEHDLMMLRACVKFDPIFPTTGLGFQFVKDGAGQAAMTAVSAFVQEPGDDV